MGESGLKCGSNNAWTRNCLWSYSHKLFPFVKAIILILCLLSLHPLKKRKKKKAKAKQKNPKGEQFKCSDVTNWQMPHSKIHECAQTVHFKLSTQYLTSSDKPPELIQNASTLNVQTRKEPSSSCEKIMNHKVNFLLSRRLSIIVSVILLSASPCPEPGVFCSSTHTEIRKALLKIQKEDKK